MNNSQPFSKSRKVYEDLAEYHGLKLYTQDFNIVCKIVRKLKAALNQNNKDLSIVHEEIRHMVKEYKESGKAFPINRLRTTESEISTHSMNI